MKVEVHIDSHFQEEAVTITAPTLSTRVEQVRDFVEMLDQKERLRAKKDGETYLVETRLFHRFYIENRQVVGETKDDHFILTGPLYQLSEDLPSYFLKISQSEIINTKEIDHLHFTTSGSVQIYLKNGSLAYSSRRYLKAIKEKLS
jgi:hypothetical protein